MGVYPVVSDGRMDARTVETSQLWGCYGWAHRVYIYNHRAYRRSFQNGLLVALEAPEKNTPVGLLPL